jgi:hypothetical protein
MTMRRIPVLSMVAAALAAVGALVSLTLGFLVFGEDVARFVPYSWVTAFLASALGTFVLQVGAVLSGRRVLRPAAWRSAADARFLWETMLGVVATVAFGLATAFAEGFPGFVFLASVLAVYVTVARWTWWTWRALAV